MYLHSDLRGFNFFCCYNVSMVKVSMLVSTNKHYYMNITMTLQIIDGGCGQPNLIYVTLLYRKFCLNRNGNVEIILTV